MTIFATDNIVNGLLRFKGSDAEKFLQGQLTCDISKLATNKASAGAYCSPKGRVRASFILVKINADEFLMILPKVQISFLLEVMAPYVAFFQCTMTDASDDWFVYGLQTEKLSSVENLSELGSEQWQVTNSGTIISIKVPGLSSRWYCLSTQPLTECFTDVSLTDSQQWRIAELNSGMVWIDETNRDKFLPHDLSLADYGAVSFDKGCYTGQEIVARMQYRGEPKYLLAIITTEAYDGTISDKLNQQTENSEQLKIGEVVELLHLTDKKWLISASVKRKLADQQQIKLTLDERTILCNICIPELVQPQ